MTDYQKYLNKMRRHPEAVILVENCNGFNTFGNDAILVSGKLNKSIRRVDRHRTVSVSRDDISKLILAGLSVAFA
jgi:DNA mismatch repair ATPase MutS